jgi:CHAT domain-containing protein/Tfp pilus assembly protein PilF
MTRPRLFFGALLLGALAWAPSLRADEAPKAEPKAPDAKPAAPVQPFGEIKVRAIIAGAGRSPPCLCWSADAKAFFHLDAAGTVHRVRYPELTEEAANAVGRKCGWISMSAEGLVATVREAQEAWLLDPATLKEIKKIPIGRAQYAVSSPKLALAYAAASARTGEGTLTVLDLKTGKAIKQYQRTDLGAAGAGLDRPVVSADGKHLFAIGSGALCHYKLNDADVALADATEPIVKGRFEGISLSDDGAYVCAPSGGGNIGAGEYATLIYATSNLKKPVAIIASGRFPLAIGFDVKSGAIYAQNFQTALQVFDLKGNKLHEFSPDKDKVGAGVELCRFLVHPGGRRLLYLTSPQLGKTPSRIVAAELLAKDLGSAPPAVAISKDQAELVAAFVEGKKFSEIGKHKEAILFFQKAVQLAPKVYGETELRTASLVHLLADEYWHQGMYAESEPLYQRSLTIREKIHGKEHPEVADTLNNLGLVYLDQRKHAEAEAAFRRSLAIREKVFGNEHVAVAASLNNLANLYKSQRRFDEAERLLLRSLAIKEKAVVKNEPDLAQSLMSLANIYLDQKKFDQAEALYQRALNIWETAFGKEHPTVASALNNLALLYQVQGKYAAAAPLYQRCLAINETTLGKDHPRVGTALANLIAMQCKMGDFAAAARSETQFRKNARQFLLRELPSLSAQEQRHFLNAHEKSRFENALYLGYSQAQDPTIVEASAAWLLNFKAVALEAQTIRSRMEREIEGPEGQAILRDLQAVRAQEAALAVRTKQPEDAAKQREQFEARRRDLERQLARRSSTAAKVANPWVELADVRKSIPEGGVLIDIARFRARAVKSAPHQKTSFAPNYVVWLVPAPGAGDIRIIDLGDAATIDAAIQAARQAIEGTVDRLEKSDSEAKLETEVAEKLAAVAKLVFAPLKEHLGNAKKLILSPDGDLWLLPWAALPVGPKRYLIEDYSLRFVITGRDLVNYDVGVKPQTTAALILADPDYNLTPAQVAEARPALPENAVALATRSAGDDLRGVGRVKRLPGTAVEAKQAFEKLKALTGREPKLYQDAQASETIVKATRSPQVLVLATHGFFLKSQELAPKESALPGLEPETENKPPAVNDKEGKAVEDPLLRCGLLLAGANKRAQAKPGEDDGILTGLEIVGLDLRGTQMVVLSACETGVGDVQTGEGVAGLRQAFQLAGAQSVLSTLWQISDQATGQLMNTFYDELAKGTERSDALALAQRQFVKDRREKSGTAHPFFWASFTLTGK